MGVYGQKRISALDKDWSNARLSELTAHIVARHHSRLRVELPILHKSLEKVYASYRYRDFARLAPLPGLLFLMEDDLDQHMHREECTVFPEIEAFERSVESGYEPMSAHRGVPDLIAVTLTEHDSILDCLSEIRRATGNYEPPSYADQAYRALFQRLQALERDLNLHIYLESDLLFSRALSLTLQRT